MKRIIVFLLLTCSLFGQSQDENYSTVYFIGFSSFGGTARRLYLNDKLITSFGNEDIVKLKLYSKGRITVTYLSNYRMDGAINVTEFKNYYYMGGNAETVNEKRISNQEVQRHDFETFRDNLSTRKKFTYNIIEIEESTGEPIGKIDPADKDKVNEGPKQGTCFLVDKSGFLLTNFHVISGSKKIHVRGIGNDFTTLYGADVVAYDTELDIALLKLKNQNLSFANIPYGFNDKSSQQGAKSFVLGYPMANSMGEEIKVTEGIINAKSGYRGSISHYQFSAPIQGGNSGSPLFDEQGNVIGLISSKHSDAEAAGYAIKSQYVSAFLKMAELFKYTEPTTADSISSKPLTEKVNVLKNFIFIVDAE